MAATRVVARRAFVLVGTGVDVTVDGVAVTRVAMGDGLVRLGLADGTTRTVLPWALVAVG